MFIAEIKNKILCFILKETFSDNINKIHFLEIIRANMKFRIKIIGQTGNPVIIGQNLLQ